MEKKLKIRDLTLRDGQQSLFGTRMRQESINRVLPLYREAGFYIIEVWGGDVPDVMMRHLKENPWNRLRECAIKIEGCSLLSALSRGRNLFGKIPYPDYILEGVYKEAFKNGLNVMRIFDALNDLENIKTSIRMVNALGGISDAAICYTVDPREEPKAEVKKAGFWGRLLGLDEDEEPIPELTFSDDYYVKMAKEVERSGAGILTLKDMGGIANPSRIFTLMPKLKLSVRIPVDFHTHSAAGYGLASVLTAIIKGVDIVDTAIWWFAGGTSAPPIELVWIFCNKMDIPIEINMEEVGKIRNELKEIRKDLAEYDILKDCWPNDFDEFYSNMPPEIDSEFDKAIEAAGFNNEAELLESCRKIEEYFGFPKSENKCAEEGISNWMYATMVNEAHSQDADDVVSEAIDLVPKIRRDTGYIPLVYPVADIVASQAVLLALDRRKGEMDYSSLNPRFVSLVAGEYGKPPKEIDPTFRTQITGVNEERPYDVSTFQEPENPELPKSGGVKLAVNDEEFLLLELLPDVAAEFLSNQRQSEYVKKIYEKNLS